MSGVLRDPSHPCAYGDVVVVHEGRGVLAAVRLEPGGVHRSRHGAVPHASWVGARLGVRLAGAGGKGSVTLLPLTPELWTRTLRHRTQVLYAPDVAAVIGGCSLKPGCVVAETGTGSGSLSTSLARAVSPHGKLFTFEFHAPRAAAARADFEANGLSSVVTVFVRDTEATGFPSGLSGRCDAVFLDLPGPHNAAASVAACLRPGGVLCSFSPCVEQVQRLCAAAASAGLVDFRTIEALDREHSWQRAAALRPPQRSGEAQEVPQAAQRRGDGGRKRARGGDAAAAGRDDAVPPCEEAAAANADAQPMEDGGAAGGAAPGAPPGAGAAAAAVVGERCALPAERPQHRQEPPLLVWPAAEARGHTGYLTFARKPVE